MGSVSAALAVASGRSVKLFYSSNPARPAQPSQALAATRGRTGSARPFAGAAHMRPPARKSKNRSGRLCHARAASLDDGPGRRLADENREGNGTVSIIGRRGLLGTAALAALAPAVAAQQQPMPAPAGTQAPGWYRFRLGEVTVTTISDGFARRGIDGLVLNAPAGEVRGVLADAFLPTGHYDGPYTVTFLDTGSLLIAVDTGTGGQMAPTAGRLGANMAAAGIDPARVGLVLLTHCHQDHIHGLATADGRAVFPNAELALAEEEHAWWSDAANEARSPPGQRVNFANVARRFAPYRGRIRRFAAGAEVAPGIRAVAAHGHSPGHTLFHVASGAGQMMILADITHRPELFARRPDYVSLFDFDGAAAAAARRRVLDQVAAERMRVVGYHFPFPAVGHVARDGAGYRFHRDDWS
jgi:glyoxylase-like metal-dependent hydrolase (beta-lactamase superfamily II)